MDHCIVYFSHSVGAYSEEEMSVILEQSRRNNAQCGVTGVLLYVRGSIFQVLEGAQSAVEALYERIRHDARHTNVSLILSRPIAQRLFSGWLMGYETLTSRQLEQLRTIIDLDEPKPLGSSEPLILKTMKIFYDNNRFNRTEPA